MDDDDIADYVPRIVQRNDKFFLGSRYGKRISTFDGIDNDRQERLKCSYTGVTNFFRCISALKDN